MLGGERGTHLETANYPHIMPQSSRGQEPQLRRHITVNKDTIADDPSTQKGFKTRIRSVFNELDRNNDGVLHREEVIVALKLMKLPSSPVQVDAIFHHCDPDRDGVIHYKEFEAYALMRQEQLGAVFLSLDQNDDGFISNEDIKRALKNLNVTATDEDIERLMRRADLNNDGKIGFSEFQEFLLLCTFSSIESVFNYWAHASAIDIGESLAAPDNLKDFTEVFVTFCAGALAGAVSRTATAPMDRLKVLLQAGTQRGSILGGLSGIYSEGAASGVMFGGFRAFWRGNGANVIKIMPEFAIRFVSYDAFKRGISKDPEQVTVPERFVAGALAGCAGQVVVYPLEIAKTRMAVSRFGEFRGISDCVSQIFRVGGVSGLYRGLGTSVLGIIPYSGVDLALFYTLRAKWMASHPEATEGPGVPVLLAFGAVSSTAGQLVAYPFQLVRTKLQAQGVPQTALGGGGSYPPEEYSGMVDCFRRTVKVQGIKGLYRGIRPNFLKAFPAIAISYAVFEKTKITLTQSLNERRQRQEVEITLAQRLRNSGSR